MASPRLSEIDVRQIDVFAVSSAWFWGHKQSVVLSFFAQLPRNRSGLLVAKDDAASLFSFGDLVEGQIEEDAAVAEQWQSVGSLVAGSGRRMAYGLASDVAM